MPSGGNGNGHQRSSFNLRGRLARGLLSISGLPRGPFTVDELIDAVTSLGYAAEPRAPDEVLMFHHPERERPVPVHPKWGEFYENGPVFNCICADLGLTPDELVARLSASRR